MSPLKAPTGLYRSSYPRDTHYYRATGAYRPPRKGEYYLSGALPTAWQCLNPGLTTSYWIAKPVLMAECPFCEGKGIVEVEED